MRIFITAVLALAVLAVAAHATTTGPSDRGVARTALKDSLAPLLAAQAGKSATVKVSECHARACRFRVNGTARCRGVIRIRETKTDYVIWLSRLYCRTAPDTSGD